MNNAASGKFHEEKKFDLKSNMPERVFRRPFSQKGRMKIRVASQNMVKVNGVQAAAQEFDWLEKSVVEAVPIPSTVSHQPLGLEETLQGAFHRAKNVFEKGAIGVGIEGGIIPIPFPGKSLSITACCVFDGKNAFFGTSSSYELPIKVSELVQQKGIEMEEALHQTGITGNREIGQSEGFVSLLTRQRVSRKDLVKQAAFMAFSKLEQKEKYF